MNNITEIQIREFPIELNKLLKLENIVGSGGEAKNVILEGLIQLNGEIETRIRKKIFENDIISFNGKNYKCIKS